MQKYIACNKITANVYLYQISAVLAVGMYSISAVLRHSQRDFRVDLHLRLQGCKKARTVSTPDVIKGNQTWLQVFFVYFVLYCLCVNW